MDDKQYKKIIIRIKDLAKIKFINDTLVLQLGAVVNIVLGFAATIAIVRTLHIQDYGVYALILSVYGCINFFGNFSIDKVTVIKLAEARLKKDQQQINNILAAYTKLAFILSVSVCVIGFIFSPYLAQVLYGRKDIGDLARVIFLAAPFGVFYELICVIFHGFRMIKHLAIVESIFRACKTLFILIVLILGFGLFGIITALAINSLICSVIAILIYKKLQLKEEKMPHLGKILRMVRGASVVKYLKFSLWMTLDKSLFNLYDILPIIILGRFVNYAEVGYFKIAKDLIAYFVYLFWPIYRGLLVKFPSVLAQKGKLYAYNFFVKVSLFSGMVASGIAFVLLFAVPFIITYSYGNEYAPANGVVTVLLFYLIFSGFNVAIPALYEILRQVKLLVYIKLLAIVFILPFGLLLIKAKGIVGAALFCNGMILVASVLAFSFAIYILRNVKQRNNFYGLLSRDI